MNKKKCMNKLRIKLRHLVVKSKCPNYYYNKEVIWSLNSLADDMWDADPVHMNDGLGG